MFLENTHQLITYQGKFEKLLQVTIMQQNLPLPRMASFPRLEY